MNKFEGDAALCIFGAPVELDDPATAALRAARADPRRRPRRGEVQVGIGVAVGNVIAGQIGAPSRLEYTVIGDAVNEAARLTELAKRVDGHILASEETVEASTAGRAGALVEGPGAAPARPRRPDAHLPQSNSSPSSTDGCAAITRHARG